MLGFPRGQDSCSIKLYQCSILFSDWKHEFCFESGRAIINGRTDVEDETPTLRPPDVKSPLIGRDLDAEKDCGPQERGQKDKMVIWHHRHNGHEFEETLQNSENQ